tara:strand:- start:166 stop:396 length:231 start_codon:yes stop_codon:yes gene_type:complete
MSEIDYSVTWPKKTIVATVKWRDVGGYTYSPDIWHATFTDEESMKKFIQQPAVKVLGVMFKTDALMGTSQDFALWE